MSKKPEEELIVSESEQGMRLDKFLHSSFPELSIRFLKLQCANNLVQVNNQTAKAGVLLHTGDIICVKFVPKPVAARAELVNQQGGPGNFIKTLYEDDDLAIIAKPAGMHSVTLSHEDPVTVADCVAALFPDAVSSTGNEREAGLINRLDYSTSGLMIVGRRPHASSRMKNALAAGSFHKEYFAVVDGEVESESRRISASLKQADGGKKMMVVREPLEGDIPSTILFRIASVLHGEKTITLLRAEAAVARRHQIRAHLSYIGHPLTGDSDYGSARTLPDALQIRTIASRAFFLHASLVRFKHPLSGKEICLEDRPQELDRFFERS